MATYTSDKGQVSRTHANYNLVSQGGHPDRKMGRRRAFRKEGVRLADGCEEAFS